ncbi:MAG TPA: RHS repeat-associated core domain-containing protein, partial [Clostridia bacterium]|nr:RHS repeat-associated core domain-containing protein [Clostridia bacterium]
NQLGSHSYDAAGNMIDGGFEYDHESMLIEIGGQLAYTYDGDGKRIAKVGTRLYWMGVGSAALSESDTTGQITDEYIMFGGKRVAHISSATTNPQMYYYLPDHLGTTRMLTDAAGVVCYDADFFPYGMTRQIYVDTCDQNYKFTGKERDTETGLDYFGARYYASNMGRWMSPDWAAKPVAVPYADLIDPQSLNLYAYVRNSPVTKNDPDGHKLNCSGDQCARYIAESQKATGLTWL